MLIKTMILLLVLACTGLFFIEGPDGKPILTLGDLKPGAPEDQNVIPSTTTVYKWQDENGVWQFSNQPQEAAEGAETLELDGRINIIPALNERRPAVANSRTGEPMSNIKLPSGLTTVSSDEVNRMMDEVNSLEDKLNVRKEDIDKAIGKP